MPVGDRSYGQFTVTARQSYVALDAARGTETTCTGWMVIGGQTWQFAPGLLSRIDTTSAPLRRSTFSISTSLQASPVSPRAARTRICVSQFTAGSGGLGDWREVISS